MAWRFALLLILYALYPWLLAIGTRNRLSRHGACPRPGSLNDY
jgi:hypothetical protein